MEIFKQNEVINYFSILDSLSKELSYWHRNKFKDILFFLFLLFYSTLKIDQLGIFYD